MRYDHFSMLPERAFQKKLGSYAPATLEGGGGGGPAPAPAQPTTSTVTNTNIPDYAQPYVETMLGATQQQLFNMDGNQITGVKPYTPYGVNPTTGQAYSPQELAGNMQVAQNAVAGFTPMQQQAQQNIANMQMPGEYGQASNLAGMSGLGALGTTGQAGMYGGMGARAGQQAAGLSNAYGGMGAMAGRQGANIGQSLGQMSQNPNAVQNYMNPYLQASLNPQLAETQRQYDITGQQEQGAATKSGAFGGSREALMAAENQRNANMAKNQIIGQGYNNAFTNAQQQMNAANQAALAGNAQALQGYGMGLQGAGQAGSQAMQGAGIGLQGVGAQQAGYGQAGQAATNLANIGGQKLAGQQSIYGLQNNIGAQQQAQQQNVINQAIQNYAVGQQYPQQQLAFMNAQLRGLPMQASTTQQYQAAPNPVSQIAGLGATGLGAYGAFGGFKGASGGVIKMASGGINLLSKEQLAKEKNSPYISPEDKLAVMDTIDTNQKIESNPEASKVLNSGITNIPTGDLVPQQFNDGGIIAFKAGGPKGELMKQNADTMDYQDLIRQRLEDMDKGPDPFSGSEATRLKYEEALKKKEELAPYMSLIKGGLKAYGGTSPYANANIGAGAETGLEDYMKSQAAADAERKSLLANQTDTEKLKYARKMGNLDALIKAQGAIDAKTLGTLYAKNIGHGNAINQQNANYIKASNVYATMLKNELAQIRAYYKQTYNQDISEDEAHKLANDRVLQSMPPGLKDMLSLGSTKPLTTADLGKTPVNPTVPINPAQPIKPPPPAGYK